MRHRGGAVVLVQLVLGAVEQRVRTARVSAAMSSAARPALRAASACGTAGGQQPARDLGGHRLGRDERDQAHLGARVEPDRRCAAGQPGPAPVAIQAIVSPPNRHGATLSGCPSSMLASGSTSCGRGARARQGARREQPGHDRGGRRAEPAAVRDPVHAAQRQARAAAVTSSESNATRIARTIRWSSPTTGDVGGALAVDLDLKPGPGDPRFHLVMQPEREPEGVKPGPQFTLVAGTRTSTACSAHSISPHFRGRTAVPAVPGVPRRHGAQRAG